MLQGVARMDRRDVIEEAADETTGDARRAESAVGTRKAGVGIVEVRWPELI
jgi:hypothetical protein